MYVATAGGYFHWNTQYCCSVLKVDCCTLYVHHRYLRARSVPTHSNIAGCVQARSPTIVISSFQEPIEFIPSSKMSEDAGWELHYWPLVGRGEFVRLLFEEAGVPYKELNDTEILSKIYKFKTVEQSGFPNFALPVIVKGDFRLSQTPTICKYLGDKFGLAPSEEEDDAWHADQINQTIHDFIGEGAGGLEFGLSLDKYFQHL